MSLLSLSVRSTKREELIDISQEVQRLVEDAGIENGLCIVYVPHTTAAVTINEAADPDVMRDILSSLAILIPKKGNYHHTEGNSDAHIKSAIIGNSRIIPVENRRISLGRWEGIFFCEFDGPRVRKVFIRVI